MTIESRLAEIRARAEAATEGPWLHGDRWRVQGESHCACRPGYGPLIARRWMDINGKYMWAHVHESPEPYHPHGILARNDGEPLSVVVETTEYGTMSAEDAEFIAASRTDLPALLAAVETVRETCTLAIDEFEDPAYEANGYALGIVASSRTILHYLTAALDAETTTREEQS